MNQLFRVYLVILIFAPLAFGTVELWSLSIVELTSFLAVLVWFALNWKEEVCSVPGITALLLFLGYLLFQITPLPSKLVELISPVTYQYYQGTIGFDKMPGWLVLSVSPRSTLSEFYRYTAYVCMYFLTVQLLASPKKLHKLVVTVITLGSFIALLALIQKFLPNGKIYWLRASPEKYFVGPFVYKNHFAGFMEMVLPVTVGMFFYLRPRFSYKRSLRAKLVDFFDRTSGNYHVLTGFVAVLMAASIFASLSRGGSISVSIAVCLLLYALFRRNGNKNGIYVALSLVCFAVIAIDALAWEELVARFGQIQINDGRINLQRPLFWQDSLEIIKDFSLFGTGYGTFGDIFPTYRSFGGHGFLYHAHNDYLQTVVEGGVVALVLIAWFLLSVFIASYRAYRQRRDKYSIVMFWSSVSGVIALLIHSVCDFNFQNGANALYFFLLLGLMVSVSHTRRFGKSSSMLKKKSVANVAGISFAGVFIVMLSCLAFQGGKFVAGTALAEAREITSLPNKANSGIEKAYSTVTNALEYNPLDSYLYFQSALFADKLGETNMADKHYRKAIRLNPLQATYLQSYGLFLSKHKKWNAGEHYLQSGVKHDRSRGSRLRRYGKWLIENKKDLEGGLAEFGKAMELDSGQIETDITYLIESGYSKIEIRQVLAKKTRVLQNFARYLLQHNEKNLAESLYRESLQYVASERDDVAVGAYLMVFWFFNKNQKYDDALDVIMKAIDMFPGENRLHLAAAGQYKKLGLPLNAKKEYAKVLALDPGNRKAHNGLSLLDK